MGTIIKLTSKSTGNITYKARLKTKLLSKNKTFKLREHAEQWLNEKENNKSYMKIFDLHQNKITFNELYEEYFYQWKGNDSSKIPRANIWLDFFNNKFVIDIQPYEIFEKLNNYKKTGSLSNKTVNRLKSTLSAILRYAITKFYINTNPCKKVKHFSEGSLYQAKALTKNEMLILLNKCKESTWDKMYLIVLMSSTIGGTRGELMNSKWENIDFDKNTIKFTGNKKRTVVLTNDIKSELLIFKADSGYIFGSKTHRLSTTSLSKPWRKIVSELDFDGFRFQDLRYTYMTILAKNKTPLLTISKMAGHKTIQATKNYTGLDFYDELKTVNDVFN